jgi:hypothetical protein
MGLVCPVLDKAPGVWNKIYQREVKKEVRNREKVAIGHNDDRGG